jgi:ABC-type glutathione transport system ATPase component
MQALPREHDGLLLHGAAIELDGMGLACCGPSGAGKTTLSRLAAGRAEVWTDETLVVSLAGMRPMLVSTPFWGASTPPEMVRRRNRRLPLQALLLLEQGPEFALESLDPAQAVLGLLVTEKVAVERVSSALAWLAVVERLVAQVPVYRLHFHPAAELWAFLALALPKARGRLEE